MRERIAHQDSGCPRVPPFSAGTRSAASWAKPGELVHGPPPTGIDAVGDVTRALPFTHVAAYNARIAAVNALFPTPRKVN